MNTSTNLQTSRDVNGEAQQVDNAPVGATFQHQMRLEMQRLADLRHRSLHSRCEQTLNELIGDGRDKMRTRRAQDRDSAVIRTVDQRLVRAEMTERQEQNKELKHTLRLPSANGQS